MTCNQFETPPRSSRDSIAKTSRFINKFNTELSTKQEFSSESKYYLKENIIKWYTDESQSIEWTGTRVFGSSYGPVDKHFLCGDPCNRKICTV